MHKILWTIFEEIIEKIAFDRQTPLKIGDLTVAKGFDKMCHFAFFEAATNIFNLLSGGFLAKHKLIEPSKKAHWLSEKLIEVLSNEYHQRMNNNKDSELGTNVMDLVVKHNRSASKDNQMSPLEMVKNLMNFQVAGIDTSKNTCEFFLQYLARYPGT